MSIIRGVIKDKLLKAIAEAESPDIIYKHVQIFYTFIAALQIESEILESNGIEKGGDKSD